MKNNLQKSDQLKKTYENWKKEALNNSGYFVIFNGFLSDDILKKISGNALKLYIYLGLHSKNMTGEVWHTNNSISKYFNRTDRTIRTWIKELENLNLIYRMQLEFNGVAHNYLLPYDSSNKMDSKFKVLKYRIKNYDMRINIDLSDFKTPITEGIKSVFPEAIIEISQNLFKFKLLKEPSKIELRKMGYEIKSRDKRFNNIVKEYTYKSKDGAIKKSIQLFERIL